MAAILKTDLYSKLEQLETDTSCANTNSISRRRTKQEKTDTEGFKTLDHSGQCNKLEAILFEEMRRIDLLWEIVKYTASLL